AIDAFSSQMQFPRAIRARGEELGAKFLKLARRENWRNRVFDIPDEQLPMNYKNGRDIVHHGPLPARQAIYFEKLEQIIAKLRVYFKRDRATLSMIAIHYHTFINVIPFRSINNSIGMGITNYMLLLLELNPISHGHLDF